MLYNSSLTMPTVLKKLAELPKRLQDLSPAQAHLCLAVESFLLSQMEQHGCISNKDKQADSAPLQGHTLIAACSGGVDSTALLLILHYLSPRLGHKLAAVHLDHALREESAEDASFVAELCEMLAIPLHSERQEIAAKAASEQTGIEEAGRNARHALFNQLVSSAENVWICTGHHVGDLQEDVLLRLIRGAGWPALGGMSSVDPGRRLLRPLLVKNKNKLVEFLESFGCPWREDASNEDLSFTRNRIRKTIIPLLQKENPAFSEAISDLWEMANRDAAYWNQALPALPPVEAGTIFIPRNMLLGLHEAARFRLYKKVLDTVGSGQVLYSMLVNLEQAWKNNQGGKRIQFSGNKQAEIRYGGIIFSAKS
ncbi:tRNA lysidine(34) synthetase TilS [Oleidesulfovibrio sp.]|uniref:tRNA lysidine(34) synthetase TilS n=1 Tax=Oleidesulfovibrio sp. TaxID=2909707 RepID=UPI003A83AE5C